jgi:hypothetical protein
VAGLGASITSTADMGKTTIVRSHIPQTDINVESIAFIVSHPVKREIFVADFRDRIVHHWLINKLNPLFEAALFTTVTPAVWAKAHI